MRYRPCRNDLWLLVASVIDMHRNHGRHGNDRPPRILSGEMITNCPAPDFVTFQIVSAKNTSFQAKTSGQSNLTKGRIAPLVTTNSLVARGRQGLMPPQGKRRTRSFAAARGDKSAGMSSALKIAPSHGGSGPHLIRGSLGPPQSSTQTASIGLSVQPFLQGSIYPLGRGPA